MGGFGGHVAAMIASYNFNRNQLKRREKRDPTLSKNQNLSRSRQPFKSVLSDAEKSEIANRQRLLGQKKRRSNRIRLLMVSVIVSSFIIFAAFDLLQKLEEQMNQPEKEEMTYGQPGPEGYVHLHLGRRDYSPLEPEPENRFN